VQTIINQPKMSQSNNTLSSTSLSREQEAVDAYSNWLFKKGLGAGSLTRRVQHIQQLNPYLQNGECNAHAFRDAVDIVLCQSPAEQWPYVLAVIREYFNFWIKDFKAIAALNKENNLDIELLLNKPLEGDLHSIWARLDEEKFTMIELWPIKAYTMALRQEGGEKSLVDTRVKLVKLLLMRLRDAPEMNHKHYRLAVDSVLPLFKAKETRILVLAVAREFYYFWIGDPEAVGYIQIESAAKLVAL
jgi:hypothetical protein